MRAALVTSIEGQQDFITEVNKRLEDISKLADSKDADGKMIYGSVVDVKFSTVLTEGGWIRWSALILWQ